MALDKITTGIIADDAVTAAKIVAGAVGTSEIADGTVVAADIGADAVGTAELANDVTISTSGNIATTGSGTLTVAGTSTLTGNATASGNLTVTGDVIPSTPLSHRNIVINGAMQVSQRGTSEASISGTSTGYKNAPDRMWFGTRATGTWTVSQSTEAPEGFGTSYKVYNTTADASLAANSYLQLSTKFEGQDLQHLKYGTSNAETTTLSFYVRSNLTGVFPVELEGTESTNRHISKTYTINTADTWERKEVTFAGDTSVASDNDNGQAISIIWWLASGTNYTSGTLASSWQNMDSADRAVGIANNLGAGTTNDFHITGIQWELGSNATPFEHRSYGDELARCQRYFYQLTSDDSSQFVGLGGFYNATQLEVPVTFPTTMRTNPTFSSASVTNGYSARNEDTGNDQFDGWTGVAGVNKRGVMIYTTSGMNGSASVGQTARVYTNNASSSIAFSAEL